MLINIFQILLKQVLKCNKKLQIFDSQSVEYFGIVPVDLLMRTSLGIKPGIKAGKPMKRELSRKAAKPGTHVAEVELSVSSPPRIRYPRYGQPRLSLNTADSCIKILWCSVSDRGAVLECRRGYLSPTTDIINTDEDIYPPQATTNFVEFKFSHNSVSIPIYKYPTGLFHINLQITQLITNTFHSQKTTKEDSFGKFS